MFNDIVAKVTSRKFLLAVAAFCTFVANKEYGAAVTTVLGYFGVNVVEESDIVKKSKKKGKK